MLSIMLFLENNPKEKLAMKRCKVIVLFFFILLLLLPGAAHAARKEVAYKAELDYPPYKYILNGYLTGFDIEQYFFNHSEDYAKSMRLRTISGIAIGCCLLAVAAFLLRMYIRHLRRIIRAEQQFFEDVIEHTGILVWAVQEDKTVLRLNKYGERVTGLSEQEIVGKSLDDVEAKVAGVARLKELLYRAIGYDFDGNVEFQIPNGVSEGRYFTFRTMLIKGLGSGASDAFVLIGIDINEFKRNERKLESSYGKLEATHLELAAAKEELQDQNEKLSFSEQRFRLAVEASGAFLWEYNYGNQSNWVSERWYEVMGYEPGELDMSVETVLSLVHPDDRERSRKARDEHLAGLTPVYESEYRMRTKDGRYFWFEVRGKALVDRNQEVPMFLGSLIDVTNRKQMELKLSGSYQELEATYEQLAATQQELVDQYGTLLENQKKMHHLAYYDSLSHLPNRLCLLETMEEYFQLPGGSAALLFVDTDNFKYINDTMGHKFGDILIRQVSEKLQSSIVREGSMLSRLGGDEFVVFIKDIKDREEVLALAERLFQEFKIPFQIGESSVYISVSIGISFYPADGTTTEEILKNADVAMYRAKEAGKGIFVVYDKSMHTEFKERMMIEKHLRSALDNEEFELFYQPQVNLLTGDISGFEALIRWNSPDLGFVSPLSFIKIAEDSRLIIPIGEWVLRQACHFMAGLCRQRYNDYRIAVNISVIQLLQDNFIPSVLGILTETGISPKCLELEITESVFMESFERIVDKLEYLQSKGIRIALDDFGTGYSSLSYLQQLPISTLKIDKAFIDPLSENSYSQSFIKTMVSLGHEMGLEVVAEGVEDRSQLAFLKKTGCDKVQGYLISKPLSQRNTQDLLKRYGHDMV
ncbi:EAL domain-containing protein [Paenibacillus rhizophilus]|uniref:EAL domain-containing protein n=2 Tax=Paenibacillus rhizophilus TaxID=1850366 RepID=A0A3N9P778_9BACL|nr:EAL domain-containing protein [Paenibacillus rhizophilus]